MYFLIDSERTQLKVQHRQERDGRIRDRIKAVLTTSALRISPRSTIGMMKRENDGKREKITLL